MAKLKIKKFELCASQSDAKQLIEALQKLSCVELEKIDDDRFFPVQTKETVVTYDRNITVVSNALTVLEKHSLLKKGGMFSGRETVESQKFYDAGKNIDSIMKCAHEIVNLDAKISDASLEIVRCENKIRELEVWKRLDLPSNFKGTKFTKVILGTFPYEADAEKIVKSLIDENPEICEYNIEVVYSSRQMSAVCVLCHNEVYDFVFSSLRKIGFTLLTNTDEICAGEKIESLKEQINALENTISQSQKDIQDKKDCQDKLKLLYDYLSVKRDEYKNLENAAFSQKTMLIKGYIPERNEKAVKKVCSEYSCAVEFFEPDENDDVPVELVNGKFSEPVEGITKMYALPSKKDIDPSSIMAFFYYLLFGMMLSDAGYGLAMVLGCAFILKKTSVEGSMRKNIKMFLYSGISTTIWGALFGSWFGDLIPVICTNFLGFEKAPDIALWFEPIKDPIKLLLFSFLIGIFHLFLGLITFGVIQWKNKNYASAIFDTVPIILTVSGAAALCGNILMPMPKIAMEIGKYLAIIGVVLIVLTTSRTSKNILVRLGGGLYGLYNVASGYLSDILSYSRLLALGLATGSIASVVNMIGVMPEGTTMKAVMLIVVCLIGHPLNMAINVLGAYVHANRLQFVELFSKFYEGGGRAFEPLKIDTKFFKLKEETKNG